MRYLLITYYTRPSGKIDEVMTVVNRVRRKDYQTASVILDFKEQQVVQATMNGTSIPKDWDRIVGYYYQHYSSTIERLFQENGHAISIKAEPQPTVSG